jgi:DNA-binding MarR family transcriptional regulator
VGHLILHRVEALVRWARPTQLEPLQFLLLKALAAVPGESLEGLQARLHLDRQLLGRLLRKLSAHRLIDTTSGFRLTAEGLRALEQGAYPQTVFERRVFYFADNEQRQHPPHFLPLIDPPTQPWPAGGDWRFDVDLLCACVRQPPEWKRRFGFPLEVEQVIDANADCADVEPWRRVIVDRPERLLVLLVQGKVDGGDCLRCFSVRPASWTQFSDSPLFMLGDGWSEALPALASSGTSEAWTDAWQAWAATHGIPQAAAETESIQISGTRLKVKVASAARDRLREVLKGDTWLLAGSGRIRPAANLEITA